MKIVFVAPRYHTNQHAWVKALKAAGHEVHFIVAYADPMTENRTALTPEVVPHTPLPRIVCWCLDTFARLTGRVARTDFHSLPSHHWLRERFAQIAPDVVIVRHSTYPLSIAAFIAANHLKLKTILYNQDPLDAPYNWSTRFLQKCGVVPRHRITPLRRDSQSTHYAPTNSYYVPLIVDTDFDISSRTYCPDGVVRFLFVGKFNVPRKQHRLMLEAFAAAAKDAPATLTMTGYLTDDARPFFASLQQLATTLSIHTQVTFTPNLSHTEMLHTYMRHDVFVLPSTDEPFSISTLEAMAHGLVIIVTDTNGTKWSIPNNGGIVISANDVIDTAKAIKYYIDNSVNISYLGNGNAKYSSQNYHSNSFLIHFTHALE